MKKLVSIFLCIAMLVTLFGCAASERDLTEDEHVIIEEIFTTLCDTFNVDEIDFPNVKIVSDKKIVEISGMSASTAVYDTETKTVYIQDMTSPYSNALIAHELVHYINHYKSGFPIEYGFDYFITEEFECGFYLTEGITQYMSSKLYPMPDSYAAYPFEMMIAEQLSSIVGEEKLFELFLSSDVETFKNEFNKLAYKAGIQDEQPWEGVTMTPFDGFSYFVDCYSNTYYTGNLQYQEHAYVTLDVVWTIAKQTNKLSEFNNILDKLIERYPQIFGFLYA